MPPIDPLKTKLDPVFTGQKPKGKAVPSTAYNVLANQKYTSATPNAPEGKTPQEKTLDQNQKKSLIRTYQGDLQSAILADHLSSINIAIAENEKMHKKIQPVKEEGIKEPANPSDFSKSKILIFISVILIIAGIIGFSSAFIFKKINGVQITKSTELPSLITTEYRDELNINGVKKNELLNILAGKINGVEVTVNNFYSPYLTTGTSTNRRLVSTQEFVTLLNFEIPDTLKRNLSPDFMVGMYSFGKNLPFVIFKTSSFENTYGGMLEWEKDLEKDFQILFRLPGYEVAGGIQDELVPKESKKFEDSVIANKDVRLLREEDGQTIFLYSLVDKETVIITVSDTALKEIMNRLNKERSLKR